MVFTRNQIDNNSNWRLKIENIIRFLYVWCVVLCMRIWCAVCSRLQQSFLKNKVALQSVKSKFNKSLAISNALVHPTSDIYVSIYRNECQIRDPMKGLFQNYKFYSDFVKEDTYWNKKLISADVENIWRIFLENWIFRLIHLFVRRLLWIMELLTVINWMVCVAYQRYTPSWSMVFGNFVASTILLI